MPSGVRTAVANRGMPRACAGRIWRSAGEETGVTHYEQPVIDRDEQAPGPTLTRAEELAVAGVRGEQRRAAERAARSSLRAQIARLEREHSAIVAERFPHSRAPVGSPRALASAPSLLDLGELERSRDRLAASLQELRARVEQRVEHERRARDQLERMRLEPGRYKFVRLPVRDLGQGVCGFWEVRPRLGLIGMLAGWWQLKLSSGCPLARGLRSTRGPGAQR